MQHEAQSALTGQASLCAQDEQWTSDESSETDGDWSGSESGSEASGQADGAGTVSGKPSRMAGRLLEARRAGVSGSQTRKRKAPPGLSPRTPPGKPYVARPRLSVNGKRIGRPPKLQTPGSGQQPREVVRRSVQTAERNERAQRKQDSSVPRGAGQSVTTAAARRRSMCAAAAGSGSGDESSADSASDLESASDGGPTRPTRRITRAAARRVHPCLTARLLSHSASRLGPTKSVTLAPPLILDAVVLLAHVARASIELFRTAGNRLHPVANGRRRRVGQSAAAARPRTAAARRMTTVSALRPRQTARQKRLMMSRL